MSEVSTRLICDAVGVKAPTLYYHFADYSGLLTAVVEHAFERYFERWNGRAIVHDPYQQIRDGWDTYIAFSQDEPALYTVVAHQNLNGELPQAFMFEHDKLIEMLRAIGATQPLRYQPEIGAQILTAACIGVASMLAAQQHGLPLAPELSAAAREAVLSSLIL